MGGINRGAPFGEVEDGGSDDGVMRLRLMGGDVLDELDEDFPKQQGTT